MKTCYTEIINHLIILSLMFQSFDFGQQQQKHTAHRTPNYKNEQHTYSEFATRYSEQIANQ